MDPEKVVGLCPPITKSGMALAPPAPPLVLPLAGTAIWALYYTTQHLYHMGCHQNTHWYLPKHQKPAKTMHFEYSTLAIPIKVD